MGIVRKGWGEVLWAATMLVSRGIGRLTARLRDALLAAMHEEHDRAAFDESREQDKDLFERLPDPPQHLDIGDVKYFDGKFRYF